MSTALRAKYLKDEIGKAVDDARHIVESRRGLHHAEYAGPCKNAVKVPKFAFETSEDRQCGETSSTVSVLLRDFTSDPSQRFGKRAIQVRWPMPETNARVPTIRTHPNGRTTPGGIFGGAGNRRPSSFNRAAIVTTFSPLFAQSA